MTVDIWLDRVPRTESVNIWKEPTVRRKIASVVLLFVDNYNSKVTNEEPTVSDISNYFYKMNNWAADLIDVEYVIEEELRKHY